jgi:hypothetical protein
MSSPDPNIEALARRYQADRLCERCRARLARQADRYRHQRVRPALRKLSRSLRRKTVAESAVCPGCGAVRS